MRPIQQRWEEWEGRALTLHRRKGHGAGDREGHQPSRCLSYC